MKLCSEKIERKSNCTENNELAEAQMLSQGKEKSLPLKTT